MNVFICPCPHQGPCFWSSLVTGFLTWSHILNETIRLFLILSDMTQTEKYFYGVSFIRKLISFMRAEKDKH